MNRTSLIRLFAHDALANYVQTQLAWLFGNAELLVERLSARFPAQKVFEDIHLLLRSTALEHSVSVPSPFLGIHGVVLEDRVEHVGGVHLGGEVAVVAATS